MLDEQDQDSVNESATTADTGTDVAEAPKKTTRTRRATAKPAAEPVAEAEPVETHVLVETHVSSFAPKGSTRKAASRRKADPGEAAAAPLEAAAADEPVVPMLAVTPAAEAAAEPVRRTRRVRASRAEADQPGPTLLDAPAETMEAAAPAEANAAADAAGEPARHTTRTRSSRGRTRAAAEPLPDVPEDDGSGAIPELSLVGPGDEDDPIAQALDALGRLRAPKVTRTLEVDAEQEEALDNLASVIASDGADWEEGEDGSIPRRRRRRRGGRKRHREGGADDAADSDDEAPADDGAGQPDGDAPAGDQADQAGDDTQHHRRRRRRRGDDTAAPGDDQDARVVVKVREPRPARPKPKPPSVSGIDGSTRLEAKKQRRREGRAASRRRAPILSEAEFLARRESTERRMLIRQKDDYSQIAVIEDGILVEHYVDRASAASLIGNIYLGKVQNVLPGMEAAFVDIGRGRNAVLYAGEVDWDSFGDKGQNRKIEDVFSAGQLAVVQVSKDPVGAKGARLTSHISIPGRYVVYAPKGHVSGISRKLNEAERLRLKSILDSLLADSASVVIRTAAEAASEEELVHDVNRLKAQWEVIEKKAGSKQAPQLLYAEPDLTMRIVRDLFTEDFSGLIVDGNGGLEDAYETVRAYVDHVAPHLLDRVERWDHGKSGDLFAKYRIDEQIAKALDRKVYLPSGGSLVIDRTEAMTVIDVNTGKFTGAGGNLEATVTSNNLEAAEEIVRQLRLRDIGGIIIIDFIDMVLPSNRELLLRRLVECLGRDRTRHQVSEVTSLGLVQLTRKKVGTGLAEAFTKTCEACEGLGRIRFDEPVDTQAPADGGERHSVRRSRRRNQG